MKLESILQKSCSWIIILFPFFVMAGRGVADSALTLAGILFLIFCIARKDSKPFQEKWFIVFLIFWGYMILRSLFSNDINLALGKSLPIIRYALFGLCFQHIFIEKPEVSKKILISCAIVLIFLAIDGYIQFFTGVDLLGRPKFDAGGYYRLTGPFPKLVLGSMVSVLSFPLIYYCMHQVLQNKKHMIPYTALCLLIYSIIMFSGERGPLIQTTACIGIAFFIISKKPIKILSFGVPLFAAAFAILYFVGGNGLIDRQFASIIHAFQNYSANDYGKLYNAGLSIVKEHWFLGVGPKHYAQYCEQISDTCYYHPHNIYLELLTDGGIVGLSIFGSLLYVLLKPTFTFREQNSLQRIIAVSITIFVMVKFFPFTTHTGLFKNWYGVPLWFLIGWMLHANRILEIRQKV